MGILDRLLGRKTARDGLLLGRFLVSAEYITATQLEAATKAAVVRGGTLGTVMFELGFIDLSTLAVALGRLHKVEPVDVAALLHVTEAETSSVPTKLCVKHRVVSLGIIDNRLHLAMENPTDDAVIREVFLEVSQIVTPLATPSLLITHALREHYDLKDVPQRVVSLCDELRRDPGSADRAEARSWVSVDVVEDVLEKYGIAPPSPVPAVMESPNPAPAALVAKPSTDTLVKLAKAALYRRQGKLEQALLAYRLITKADPHNARAQHGARELEEELGIREAGPEEETVAGALRTAALVDSLKLGSSGESVADSVMRTLERVDSRQQLGQALLEAALEHFKCVALFTRDEEDLFVGWMGRGGTLEAKDLTRIVVPAFVDTVLQEAASTDAAFAGVAQPTHANEIFFGELDRDPASECVCLPVYTREGRVQILLYADADGEPIDQTFTVELQGICRHAGEVLSQFIERPSKN